MASKKNTFLILREPYLTFLNILKYKSIKLHSTIIDFLNHNSLVCKQVFLRRFDQ